MANRIQLRRDTSTNWTSVNPILSQGELGVELNTGKFKIGNGITAWAALPYFTLNYADLTGTPPSGNGSSDRLVNGAKEIVLDANGSLTVPYPTSDSFRIRLDSANFVPRVGKTTLTLTGAAWDFYGAFVYRQDGQAQLAADNGPLPSLTNPGYEDGDTFEIDSTAHGIQGYVLTVLLSNVVQAGPAGWTASLAFSEPPAYPSTITSLGAIKFTSNNNSWVFGTDGVLTTPGDILPDGDATRSLGSPTRQWKEIFVSTGSIYIGNVKLSNDNGTLQINTIETVINPDTQEEEEVILETESVQFTRTSHLELTNVGPFITQPVTLGTPVTVTVTPSGINAQITVVIDVGPTLDTGLISIAQAGTGYSVGQRYRLRYFNIGGPDENSSIDFEVETVGPNGEILTVINAAFVGAASNTPGTYTSNSERLASVFDQVDIGLTLARDGNQGIYNIDLETEYDNNTYLSPLGTAWNSDGWGDLTDLRSRSYTTWRSALNNQVGNNIVGAELVMHDIANDKYYTFSFPLWGGSNGGYEYTRTQVTDPNYFKKVDNGSEVDVIIPDDGLGAGVGITRAGNNSIYNPYREASYNQAVSPEGTLWNIEGWDDLSNIETRTYLPFYAAFNGGLGNKVPGSKTIMYVPDNGKYYAVQWLSWTQVAGGGFSYVRRELDLTKVNEGLKFADGTVLKSAAGVGRVKSTASGDRRIEEVVGSNTVSVTGRVTNNYTGLTSITSNGYELRIARTPELDAILIPVNQGSVNATFTLSYDNITYRAVWLSSVQQTEYWFYYEQDFGQTTPQTQDDAVYLTVTSGGDPVVWWRSADLPGGGTNFRGAVIDYHAYTGESTIIGTIHIVDDSGEEHISHQEVQSGSSDGENDDLWLVQNEGTVSYRRIDGESKTLKVHWTAKVFYGTEFYD